MIGSLRFAGVFIISVWLGAAVFFLLGVGPAAYSPDLERLLGAKNYPYYSGAIAQVLKTRMLYFGSACGAAALLHVLAVWLYLGRMPGKGWLALLVTLVCLNLVDGALVQPKIRQLHLTAHAVNVPAAVRESAARSGQGWRQVDTVLTLSLVAGLAVYLWRVMNPSDGTRFVSAVKFRG